MHIRRGLQDDPEAAHPLQQRRALRRAAVRAAAMLDGRHCFATDHIEELPRDVALSFQPRLRRDASLDADCVRCGSFEIELDAFEHAVVDLADGQRAVAALVALAAGRLAGNVVDADPVAKTLRLLGALAAHDMLDT